MLSEGNRTISSIIEDSSLSTYIHCVQERDYLLNVNTLDVN